MAQLVDGLVDGGAPEGVRVDPYTGVPIPTKDGGLDFPTRDAFMFAFHPDRWMFYPGAGRVLPCLGEFAVARGVNNTVEPQDSVPIRMKLEKEGWKVLGPTELEDLRDLVPNGVATKPWLVKGGKAYLPIWCTPIHGGRGALQRDQAGFEAFLAALVDRGAVPALAEHVRLRGLSQAKRALTAAERDGGPSATTVVRERIARARQAVDGWKRGTTSSAPAAPAAPARVAHPPTGVGAVLEGNVDSIRTALATGDYDASLAVLVELEDAGKARKSILKALELRQGVVAAEAAAAGED